MDKNEGKKILVNNQLIQILNLKIINNLIKLVFEILMIYKSIHYFFLFFYTDWIDWKVGFFVGILYLENRVNISWKKGVSVIGVLFVYNNF